MKKYRYEYDPHHLSMPSLTGDSLFLDIETTGFRRNSTFLTVIGLAWQENNKIIVEQWFNNTGQTEEPLLLIELEKFLKTRTSLPQFIHYNGTTFDLPYLKHKYTQYHLPSSLPECLCLDLYHVAKKYRHFLNLEGLKQKNLEEAFGLFREDTLSGQELIDAYTDGINSGDSRLLSSYLLHNKEDMEGMIYLQHLLNLDYFLQGEFLIKQWEEASDQSYLLVDIESNYYLYKSVQINFKGIHFDFQSNKTCIRIPIKNTAAKYYYENYKDYYYLPAEDRAIHKSVAEYVEKDYRVKASRETCYIRKTGTYLPLPLPSASRRRKECLKECAPFDLFYENYGDDTAWILRDNLTPAKLHTYIKWLLRQSVL